MGHTIKKEITTERFLEGIQIRSKITKEATGMDFIVTINGFASSLIGGKTVLATASKIPESRASKNPPAILKKENQAAFQNPMPAANSKNRRNTTTGDTRSISCPMR